MYRHLHRLSLITATLLIWLSCPLQVVEISWGSSAALAQAQTKEQRRDEALRLYQVGTQQLDRGQFREALETFQTVLVIVREIGERQVEGATLNSIGGVYYSLGQYPQALEYYQQALVIVKQIGNKAGEGQTLHNIGFFYNTQGKHSQAETTLFAAIEAWESIRSRDLKDDQKISIFEQQAYTYCFLQHALVAQNKFDQALLIAERSRGRALVDLLDSKLSQNPNNQQNIKPPTLEEIQQIASQQNATLVQYSIINDEFTVEGKRKSLEAELYIWVIKPTGEITFRQVDLKPLWQKGNSSLTDLVISVRDSLGVSSKGVKGLFETSVIKLKEDDKINKNLQKLHQLLIAPIADDLPANPSEKVIFIPQGALFLVPLVALQDESGKYLIEKHAISTAPSIQVLQLIHQQRQHPPNVKDVLIVGNPDGASLPNKLGEQGQRLSPLPGAEEEAKAVASTLNAEALTLKKATKAAVLERMPSARIQQFSF